MITPAFSFLYDGKRFGELSPAISTTDTGKKYVFSDGLTVELHETRYPAFDAVKWVLNISHKGNSDSGLISDLWDCDFEWKAPGSVSVVTTTGNTNYATDETAAAEYSVHTEPLAAQRRYAPIGGRSSDGTMPFFDLHHADGGLMMAIGWSGQWNAFFQKTSDGVLMRSGIEGARFRLHPGETIRTSSVLIMEYSGRQTDACNKFKRLLKTHFTPVGKGGRPKEVPLSFEGFGMNTETNIAHIRRLREHGVRYGYYWIDASWYGKSTVPGFAEWAKQVGNWNIRSDEHPDGMQDIVKELDVSGAKLLLWFEPERAVAGSDWASEHPGWFYHKAGSDEPNVKPYGLLLDLGCEEAREGVFTMVDRYVSQLKLGCYRQDFNLPPLACWREADEPDRAGIHEIKHIMGLYRLWDDLLAKHPGLLIDNCSSGGRRIDIETLSRSVPIWRTDAYCAHGRNPDVIQTQQFGASRLLPYSGGVEKVKNDTYAARSCYASAFVGSWWWNGQIEVTDADLDWMAARCAEYIRLQPYLSCDFYPIENTGFSSCGWTVWQYDRPENKDGIVMIFRRKNSVCDHASFKIFGASGDAPYTFTDIDSGEESSNSDGVLSVDMPTAYLSKIIRYTHS